MGSDHRPFRSRQLFSTDLRVPNICNQDLPLGLKLRVLFLCPAFEHVIGQMPVFLFAFHRLLPTNFFESQSQHWNRACVP
jgi:hypothetical protein